MGNSLSRREKLDNAVQPQNISPLPGDVSELRNQIEGQVHLPGDPDYTLHRGSWNKSGSGWPSAIVTVKKLPEDVIACVNYARTNGCEIAVAGGRHSVFCMVNNSMVIDFANCQAVEVDKENQIVKAEAGTKLGVLDSACEPFGLAVVAGHNPDTGIAGLTLAGGLGWLSRMHGMTIDNLISVDLVTATGEFLQASNDSNPDLFWAVRGGGGNFGIVTKFVYHAVPVPKSIQVATKVWLPIRPLFKPEVALRKCRDYIEKAMTLEENMMIVFPSKGPLVTVWTSMSGEKETNDRNYANFIENTNVWTPLSSLKTMSYHTGLQRETEKKQGSCWAYERAPLISNAPDELLEIIWKHTHEDAVNSKSVTLLQVLGGKMGEVDPTATPFYWRNAKYWMITLSLWDGNASNADEKKKEAVEWARSLHEKTKKFHVGTYAAPISNDETKDAQLDFGDYYGANAARLRELKSKYDPENLFHLNRNILPDSEA